VAEEALGHGHGEPHITIRFGEAQAQLELTATGAMDEQWPTPAMRERVALCGRLVSCEDLGDMRHRLVVRLPRVLEEALP
jgi:hypothetical protein